MESIKIFGKIYYNNYKFKKCPNNIKVNRKYIISGDNQNVIIKTGTNNFMGTISENELEKGINHKWKIKILKKFDYSIMVGVSSSGLDIYSSNYNTSG